MKKVTFCCPHHGILKENIEYISTPIGNKILTNLPIMFCHDCGCYYTPFTNLLAFTRIEHNDRSVKASKSCTSKSWPKESVKPPSFIDAAEKPNVVRNNDDQSGTIKQRNISLLNKSHGSAQNNSSTNNLKSNPHSPNKSGINTKLYLSNTYAVANGICPVCSSVLNWECVNIPVIEENGDFFRYYIERTRYCYKCRKAFITEDSAARILARANRNSSSRKTLRMENATTEKTAPNRRYIFSPTLNNSYAIFSPGKDYQNSAKSESDEMNLNSQSFLGEMGYSVNKNIDIRRQILINAIKKHGKRKVCDHLAFLIATRRGQTNGARKYANAIRIWQEDINFISGS